MKNDPIVLVALGLLLAADVAVAQQIPSSQPVTTTTSAGSTEFLSSVPAGALLVTEWYNQSVYDQTNTKIGDISDVLISPIDGKITALIIGVGGFLGLGEKYVAVAFSEVKWTLRDSENYPTIHTTKEALRVARGLKHDPNSSAWIVARRPEQTNPAVRVASAQE
jgi:sporulation protein YlmC with PRC-barrel domain